MEHHQRFRTPLVEDVGTGEEYYRHVYASKTELVAAIDKWVRFYNSKRRHSAIGMLSPDD